MSTEHCPSHEGHQNKIEGGDLNDIVVPVGTMVCVKGSTDATDIIEANGTTSLVAYLDNGHDVSYYVTYGRVFRNPTSSTTEPLVIPPVVPAPAEVPFGEVKGTECVTPDGFPYTTSYAECPPPIETSTAVAEPTPVRELPATGIAAEVTIIFAIALIVSGLLFWWAGRR